MKLDRIKITNYKSIKDITIKLKPSCRVLVGINESGKTNILNALAFLDRDRKPNKNIDLREALPNEDPIEESGVDFIFKFEKNETDQLLKNVSSKLLTVNTDPKILQLSGGKIQKLKEYCAARNEGLYCVDILEEEGVFRYWAVCGKILNNWKKPSASCPPDYIVDIKGKIYQLSNYKLINTDDIKDVPSEYLEDAEIKDLYSISGQIINETTEKNFPKILFWEYDEGNLLPNTIKIDDFSGNPEVCAPLKNMFTLAGIKEISSSISGAKARGNNQFQNYLDGIAKKTTNHFKSVWKEYKHIEFSLRLNGDQIEPGIKEKNTLDFSKRSDGFKRFVTFLLLISVNVKTKNFNNALLLIDEPEISLHPTGARYLREELIKISKTNYVVYSTHSIFMIDSGDISRHYIVNKKNEITDIEIAKDSNIANEEVLYNALGHSVFSILKEKNLIFEGWKDKHLFLTALQGASGTAKNKFKDYGICHAKGVGSIKAITPMIELANRKCLIISDSDKPAKEEQKIYRQDKGFGEWKKYQEIDSSIPAITGEDFVKNDYIARQIKKILANNGMPIFTASTLQDRNKLFAIIKWLTDNGMSQDQAKDTLSNIKNTIFENLKHSDIESDYNKMLDGISL